MYLTTLIQWTFWCSPTIPNQHLSLEQRFPTNTVP